MQVVNLMIDEVLETFHSKRPLLHTPSLDGQKNLARKIVVVAAVEK